MKKHIAAFLVSFCLFAALAFAGTPVDQGSPGKQGPWPVTIPAPTWPSDGGNVTNATNVGTYPYPCAATSPMRKVWMDGGVQTMGTTSHARLYIVVTNVDNDQGGTGTGYVKCRVDGTAPNLTAGSPGTVLLTNYSVVYTNPEASRVRCIGASQWVGTYECEP